MGVAQMDRLEARKHPELNSAVSGDGGLSVIAGTRPEPLPVSADNDAAAVASKPSRITSSVAAAKAALHTMLVERHADEVDITDRAGVRPQIDILYAQTIKCRGSHIIW